MSNAASNVLKCCRAGTEADADLTIRRQHSGPPMTTFTLKSLPIQNGSDAEIQRALEPEGDVPLLPGGAQCHLCADGEGTSIDDVELEYENGRIAVHASCRKRVTVDGVLQR